MSMDRLSVTHINLARGFRGGERQTELLVRELAADGYHQQLMVRADSPLLSRLHGTAHLTCIALRRPYLLSKALFKWRGCVHAHEAKAAQLAYLQTRLRPCPYIITRRVCKAPRDLVFTTQVYTQAARVVAISHAVQQVLQSRFPQLPVQIIPSAAARLTTSSALAELQARYTDKFVVGHIGALVDRDKGQSVLIRAARQLQQLCPDVYFVLVGDGADSASLRTQAQDLSNIEFVGHRDNIADYLSVFKVFAYPSFNEGLGSSLLDAMQFEVPIIASDVGGIPDVVQHNHNGLLIPVGDAQALVQAVLSLRQDCVLRRRLVTKALEVVDQFSATNMAQAYARVYRALCGYAN